MPEPTKSLYYADPLVINLNLLGDSFDDQVDAVRLMLRSIHDNAKKISSESVFELGLVRVSNKTLGIEWTIDFQIVWPTPLMDSEPGEFKMINWQATGDISPASGTQARKKAENVLREKITSLIQPGGILHGKVEMIP